MTSEVKRYSRSEIKALRTCEISQIIKKFQSDYESLAKKYNNELNLCCNKLIEASLSTGHGENFTDLIDECIASVTDLRLSEERHRKELVRSSDATAKHLKQIAVLEAFAQAWFAYDRPDRGTNYHTKLLYKLRKAAETIAYVKDLPPRGG